MNAATASKRRENRLWLSRCARSRQGSRFFWPLWGLSLDIGYIYQVKRRMQTAADAAALGGCKEIWRGNTTLVTVSGNAQVYSNYGGTNVPLPTRVASMVE